MSAAEIPPPHAHPAHLQRPSVSLPNLPDNVLTIVVQCGLSPSDVIALQRVIGLIKIKTGILIHTSAFGQVNGRLRAFVTGQSAWTALFRCWRDDLRIPAPISLPDTHPLHYVKRMVMVAWEYRHNIQAPIPLCVESSLCQINVGLFVSIHLVPNSRWLVTSILQNPWDDKVDIQLWELDDHRAPVALAGGVFRVHSSSKIVAVDWNFVPWGTDTSPTIIVVLQS